MVKLYKLMKTELSDFGLLKDVNVTDLEQWTAIVPEQAIITDNEKSCKELSIAAVEKAQRELPRKGRYQKLCEICDRVYAVEYDTDDFTTEQLLDLLYYRLSLKDIKFLCEKEAWFKEIYLESIKHQSEKGLLYRVLLRLRY